MSPHDEPEATIKRIDVVRATPESVFADIDRQVAEAGGEWQEPPECAGSVGRTMFDTAASDDGTVTVLMAREHIEALPAQALVQIRSGDGRAYLGAVVRGPFA